MHVIHCPCHTLFLDICSYGLRYRSSHFPPPHYLLLYLFLSHHLSFALISSHPSALLVAFYFSYSPHFFSSPGILPVPSPLNPYHLLTSGLVPSPRRLSIFISSPLTSASLIFSHLVSFLLRQMLLSLVSSNVSPSSFLSLVTSCSFPLSLLVRSFLDLLLHKTSYLKNEINIKYKCSFETR